MTTDDRTRTTLDRDTHTLRFHRRFTAPREEVFDAWTSAERVRQWWDPSGRPLVECTIDLRPGGGFRFVNDGHSPPFAGTYQIIDRPHRLVFDAMGAVGTVALEQDGATTLMTVSIRCASAEHLAMYLQLGVDTGTARTLDNLVAHVGG